MALQKTITLPNGTSGNYIALRPVLRDPLTREVSAHFMLYASAAYATSAPDQPICLIAKLRLNGAKYDQYLSKDAIAAAAGPDAFTTQLYAAAKAEPLMAGGGLTSVDLSDAEDV